MKHSATVDEFLSMLADLQGQAEELALQSHRARSRLSDTIATDILAPIIQAHSIVTTQVAKEWDVHRRRNNRNNLPTPEIRHQLEDRLQHAGDMAARAVRRARGLARQPVAEASRLRRFAREAEDHWPQEVTFS